MGSFHLCRVRYGTIGNVTKEFSRTNNLGKVRKLTSAEKALEYWMQKRRASERFLVLALFGSRSWARTSDPLINSQML